MQEFLDAYNKGADDEEEEAASIDNSNIIQVDHDTFDDIIAANPYLLLSMTSPDCGHCQDLKPIWA